MKKTPVIFIGHGSPMNAIIDNAFTNTLQKLQYNIEKPKAILVISAHWLTNGNTYLQASHNPKQIYDFKGFPKQLYEIIYPVKGIPGLSYSISTNIKNISILTTNEWGIDHGTWAILKHIYPDADIPTIQISIDISKNAHFHYELGKALKYLRNLDVLIIGSGNIVHNLSLVNWEAKGIEPTEEWARELDSEIFESILTNNIEKLLNYRQLRHSNKGIYNPDHYIPLLYCIGAAQDDKPKNIYNGFELGTLSMRSIIWQ